MSAEASLLHRAASYALSAVDTVVPDQWTRPTPCAGWDLGTLLRHVGESVAAAREAIACGRIGLFPSCADAVADAVADPATRCRTAIIALLEEWSSCSAEVGVADRRMARRTLVAVMALELTVHGWDIVQAGGGGPAIPSALARDLLDFAPYVVPDGNRGRLFAPPVPLSRPTGPDTELLALLGRSPIR